MKDKQREYIYIYITIYRSWFSPGTPVSSTKKTDRRDIAEILILKVALNTMKLYRYRCTHVVYLSLNLTNFKQAHILSFILLFFVGIF
jgi:hypothetical protein